jgi:hypothetical protein
MLADSWLLVSLNKLPAGKGFFSPPSIVNIFNGIVAQGFEFFFANQGFTGTMFSTIFSS